jgi:hypothetical protein
VPLTGPAIYSSLETRPRRRGDARIDAKARVPLLLTAAIDEACEGERLPHADQSPLTRESARLAGLSPRTLLRNTERYCGPTHDHRASYLPLLRSRRLARG